MRKLELVLNIVRKREEWYRGENNRERKMSCRKKIDSKLWFEYSQMVRILYIYIYISIVFVHRDNGYPYPPDLTEG